MKKTLFALAAVLALSGAATAAPDGRDARPAPAAACVDKAGVKLDCGKTGSIATPKTDAAGAAKKGPRLGIDVNPWIMPSTF